VIEVESTILGFHCCVHFLVVLVSRCVLCEHLASSWLEGITLEEFGAFGGDFGTTAIAEEILNWLPFTTPPLVAFPSPSSSS
jgi:hypothetical protein